MADLDVRTSGICFSKESRLLAPTLGDAASSIGATVHGGLGGGHRLDDYEKLLKKTSESPRADAAGAVVATAALAPGAPKLMVVLTRTHRSVADFLAGALVEKSVSWEEFLVLEALLHKGPLDASSIASKVPVASTGVSRVLDSLRRRGLALAGRERRGRDELHELSPTGRRFAAGLYEKHRLDIEAVMACLSSSDVEALLQGLKKLGRRAASLRRSSMDARRGLAAWQVRKVTEYMKTHLSERVRVSDLARQVGLSASSFSRAFKVSMSISPHKWQLSERILTAQIMLREGASSLAEVALITGFAEQSHFARVFKEMVGVTPGAWQRRNRP
jgi:AraC-like DNA-binding protein/DNA-binding MarR family transcriptional regulator